MISAADAQTYSLSDSDNPGGPVYDWVDIRFTGNELIGSGSSGAASFTPEVPLLIHGRVFGSRHYGSADITVSLEGYISGLPEAGSDTTPACPLPDPFSNETRRIYAYHANLELEPDFPRNPAGVFYQYFHQSPHPHHPGGVHVFQWQRVSRSDGGSVFSFQVLAFDNGDLIMQYPNGNPSPGADYTIGTQVGTLGSTYAARGVTPGSPPAGGQPCIVNDNLTADLAVLFSLDGTVISSPASFNGSFNWQGGQKYSFSQAMNGQVITLRDPTTMAESLNDAVIIDASMLPDGITFRVAEDTNFLESLVFNDNTPSPALGNARISPPYLYCNHLRIEGGGNQLASQFLFSDSATLLFADCTFQRSPATPESGFQILHCTDIWHPSIFEPVTNVPLGEVDPLVVRADVHLRDSVIGGCATGFRLETLRFGFTMRDCEVSNTSGHLLSYNSGVEGSADFLRSRFTDCQQLNNYHQDLGRPSDLGALSVTDCEFVRGGGGGIAGDISCFVTNTSTLDISRSTAVNAHPSARFDLLKLDDLIASGSGPVFVSNCTLVDSGIDARLNSPRTIEFDHCTFSRGADLALIRKAGAATLSVLLENCIFDGEGPGRFIESDVSVSGLSVYNLFSNSEPGIGASFNLLSTDPLLQSLSYNGGPTRSLKPLRPSPAVDAGDPGFGGGLDQRGLARVVDGDSSGGARTDIGAVELGVAVAPVVTTALDEDADPGTGLSLREAIADAQPDSPITFDPSLNGATINLTLGSIAVPTVTSIDASALGSGVTITGASSTDALTVGPATTLTLENLTFTALRHAVELGDGAILNASNCNFRGLDAGTQDGAAVSGGEDTVITLDACIMRNCVSVFGGAVTGEAGTELTLRDCWFHENLALQGGAVWLGDGSSITVERCAFTRNSATSGNGGAFRLGSLAGSSLFSSTTIGENFSSGTGGGVHLGGGLVEFNYCTIFKNGGGGGITGTLSQASFYHSIVAANVSGSALLNLSGGISNGANLTDNDEGIFSPLATPPDLVNSVPHLSPLGWQGGASPCYHPLGASPAIDGGWDLWNAAEGTPELDQRGLPRVSGPPLIPTIGAVEAATPLVVTTTADQNNNPAGAQRSLREAVRDCPNGGRITFDPTLSGATLPVGNQIQFNGKALVIDATSLPSGITIDRSGGASRVVNVQGAASLSMHGISLTGGNASLSGGGIRSAGRLMLTRCAIYKNQASSGGGILHAGSSLVLENVTLFNNLTNTGAGGAILNNSSGDFRITHSTIASNIAAAGTGGIQLGSSRLYLSGVLLAGNKTSGAGTDNFDIGGGSVISFSRNLEDLNELPTGAADIHNGVSLLKNLADNDGSSFTMAFSSGSDARDSGTLLAALAPPTDARGYPRISGPSPDIGAFELSGFEIWIAANTPPGADRRFTGDADNDGILNPLEYKVGFDPYAQDQSPLMTIGGNESLSTVVIPINSNNTDFTLEVRLSHDLVIWTPIFRSVNGVITLDTGLFGFSGTAPTLLLTLRDPDLPSPRTFYQIQVTP